MPTRRAKLRRKIYAKLPNWMKNHDFEVFVSFLGLVSGIPIVTGQVTPTSVTAILPEIVVNIWGWVLIIGCCAVLGGIVQGSRFTYPRRAFWMRVEALGLTALAYYCYIYSICILGYNLTGGWVSAMFILGFGATSHVREATIQIQLEQYRLTLGLQERA